MKDTVKVTRADNKLQIDIQEGNQERWLSLSLEQGIELMWKLESELGREYYQVHYGGGEWEDSWEGVSLLYTTEEEANEFIQMLGFKKVTHPNGYVNWEQQDELDDLSYTSHWVRVETVEVIK